MVSARECSILSRDKVFVSVNGFALFGPMVGIHDGSSLPIGDKMNAYAEVTVPTLVLTLSDFKSFSFPDSTALAEEEGSFSHLSLSLENTAHLKTKFRS